jgi:CRP-like cAMP-binding protein
MLESLATSFASEQYNAGETIVQSGTPNDKFYVIASGKVEVWATGRYGQRVQLAILAEGDHFGEMALLRESRESLVFIRPASPTNICLACPYATWALTTRPSRPTWSRHISQWPSW